MENYLEIKKMDNTVVITGDESKMMIPIETIDAITLFTNDVEDTCRLVSFVYEMASSYNHYVEMELERDKNATCAKFNCSPAFLEIFCTMILSCGFNSDQIIGALSEIPEFELFGRETYEPEEDNLERVIRIINRVKSMIYDNSYSLEDDYDEENTKIKRLRYGHN